MRKFIRHRFVPLNEMFYKLQKERLDRVNTLFDKLTFLHILLIWSSVVIIFGIFYYFLYTDASYLYYNFSHQRVSSLTDHIYFSFITATSTGFGDIVPLGYFKLLSIFEVVFGLVLLAFVTSKLISIKQDVILSEIYEISFQEKINGLRSSLLLFRQNVGRIITQLEEGTLRKREVQELYIYFSSLEDVLHEIEELFPNGEEETHFTKVLDPVNMELIFNSITQSFEKIHELVLVLNTSQFEWKRDVTVKLIQNCLSINVSLIEKLKSSRKKIGEKIFHDIAIANARIVELIRTDLEMKKDQPSESKVIDNK